MKVYVCMEGNVVEGFFWLKKGTYIQSVLKNSNHMYVKYTLKMYTQVIPWVQDACGAVCLWPHLSANQIWFLIWRNTFSKLDKHIYAFVYLCICVFVNLCICVCCVWCSMQCDLTCLQSWYTATTSVSPAHLLYSTVSHPLSTFSYVSTINYPLYSTVAHVKTRILLIVKIVSCERKLIAQQDDACGDHLYFTSQICSKEIW